MKQFRKIVVGLDLDPQEDRLTEGSALALAQAHFVAGFNESEVVLVHSDGEDESSRADDEESPRSRQALDEALAGLKKQGIAARLEIRHEKAWMAITRLVLNESSDLVIVGKRNAPFLQGPLLGSVAMKLVRKCPCAVWVVKPCSDLRPKVLLAGTDLTPVGDRVVVVASALAAEWNAELHVVHSYQFPMSVQMGRGEPREEFVKRTEAAARAHIQAQLKEIPKPEAIGLHIGLSSPSHAILHGEADLKADLVVMGTISRGGVPGVLVGGTAERLISRLDCSILTVKPADFVCPLAVG